MSDLLLRNVLPWGADDATDVLVSDGRIAAVGTGLETDAPSEDLAGTVVIPGLVDLHAHLDKTMWGGPWLPRTAGPGLEAAIEYGMQRRAEAGIPSTEYIGALMGRMIASGTTHVRTHVDVDPGVGLDGLAAVREAAAQFAGRIEVETVAFPQAGLLRRPGTFELLDEALAEGADHIGGIDPGGYDGDAEAHLDAVFGLAEKHGKGVDIHLHDDGELGVREFELILERTKALAFQGRVTVSHAFALADPKVPSATRKGLIEQLADLHVSLAGASTRRPLPLRELASAGVLAGLGNDGVRDLWSPYGTGDLLAHTEQIARGSGFSRDEDIELAARAATYGGAAILGLERYGLDVGDSADLVAVEGRNVCEAMLVSRPRRLVLKDGTAVARDGELA